MSQRLPAAAGSASTSMAQSPAPAAATAKSFSVDTAQTQQKGRQRPATAAPRFAPTSLTDKYRALPVHLLGNEEDEQPDPKQITVPQRPKSAALVYRGPGRSMLAPTTITQLGYVSRQPPLFAASPIHFSAGNLYDVKEQCYYPLAGMLDGSEAAKGVADLQAKIEAREAAKAAKAAAAAGGEAEPPPAKKGKQTPEELAAEEATAAEAEAKAAEAAAAQAAEDAKQAEEDEEAMGRVNVDWMSRLEERALPLEWTPLMYAAAKGDAENVRLLLEAGANVMVRDIHGSTPLHKAAGSARHGPQKCELLVRAKADLKAVDRQGMTPLHIAASNERVDCIPTLMQLGASQWAKNGPLQDGDTPFQVAVKEGLHEVVAVLKKTEARRKGWSSGYSVLIPAQTPSWEPEPFTPKRMAAPRLPPSTTGVWDSIAFARYVPPPKPKRFNRHSSRPIGGF